jgi:3-hydroxymyristoyl/3-hydroxydecanoyl-(acyl carrier protein) dehydratase
LGNRDVRFFLIDRVTAWQPGERAEAVKNVSLSEDYLRDHFPRVPTMPGVLILESMAQLSGIILEDAVLTQQKRAVTAVLSIVERAKFRRLVKPGDQLRLVAEGLEVRDASGRTRAKAFVGDDLAASAELIFTWFDLTDAHLQAKRKEVVDLWMRGLTRV